MKKLFFVFFLILTALSCRPRLSRFSTDIWGPFDTMTQVIGYSESKELFSAQIKDAIDSFSLTGKYYDRFLNYDEIKNLQDLNHSDVPMEVSDEIMALLKLAEVAPIISNGTVSPLFGGVIDLWKEKIDRASSGNAPTLPNYDSLKLAAQKAMDSKIVIDKTKNTALIDGEGIIDVGAFAKGFAIDMMCQKLYDSGLDIFAVISGGNIRVSAKPPLKKGWIISIQNPEVAIYSDALPLGEMLICDGAIATSGDYQRFFWYEGKKMHHIINPRTLYPADKYTSVTVWAKTAMEADLYSTALFIEGVEEGEQLAKKRDLSVFWVDKDSRIRVTNPPGTPAFIKEDTKKTDHS